MARSESRGDPHAYPVDARTVAAGAASSQEAGDDIGARPLAEGITMECRERDEQRQAGNGSGARSPEMYVLSGSSKLRSC